MRIKDFPNDDRPREKLIKRGAEALSNSELLAIVLAKGSKKENVLELSQRILRENGLDSLSGLDVEDLKEVFGIGNAKAAQIVACFEIGKRLACFESGKRRAVNCAGDIVRRMMPKMKSMKKENCVGVYLDSRKKVVFEKTIFVGSLDCSVIHPREIFEPAIKKGIAAVIVVHNHPSGDPAPSEDDAEITKQLASAGEILGIEFLDHIILGNDVYYSFREQGKL